MLTPSHSSPWIRALVTVTSSALLAACAGVATQDEAGGASDSEVVAAQPALCKLPSRALAKPNAEYYRTFESYEALITYSEAFLAASGRPAPVKTRDARHERAAALLEPVYRAFEKLYPAHVAGMPGPPAVVIVQSDDLNAFAGFDDRPGMDMKGPWAFFVHSSMFEQTGFTDEDMRGLFAHELGHLVLKNSHPDIQETVKRTYVIGSKGEAGVFGALQADDPVLHARVDRFEKLAASTGKLTLPEMNGVPFPFGVADPQYKAMLGNLFSTYGATSPRGDACAAAVSAGAQMRDIVGRHYSFHDWRVDPGSDSGALDTATRTFVARAEECFDHVKQPLLDLKVAYIASKLPTDEARAQLLEQVRQQPDAARNELLDEEERAYDDAHHGESAGKLLLGLSKARLDAISALQRSSPVWSSVRQYGFEEEADDIAALVSLSIGDDPRAVGNFTLKVVPKDYRDACLATIGAGKTPYYGGLVDPHTATCWRYYHLSQLKKALPKTCGKAEAASDR